MPRRVMASELSAEVALADLAMASGSQDIGIGELSGLFGSHGNSLTEMLPTREKLTADLLRNKDRRTSHRFCSRQFRRDAQWRTGDARRRIIEVC